MMNLKKLKRRLSLTFKGNRALESSLADLTEQITIEDSTVITKDTKPGMSKVYVGVSFLTKSNTTNMNIQDYALP